MGYCQLNHLPTHELIRPLLRVKLVKPDKDWFNRIWQVNHTQSWALIIYLICLILLRQQKENSWFINTAEQQHHKKEIVLYLKICKMHGMWSKEKTITSVCIVTVNEIIFSMHAIQFFQGSLFQRRMILRIQCYLHQSRVDINVQPITTLVGTEMTKWLEHWHPKLELHTLAT